MFKKHSMTLAAFVIASITLMSFGLNSSTQAPLEWYEKQPSGHYQLMPGNPSPEPPNGCTDEEEVICAKGFLPGTAPAPSEINDETPAVDRFRPENVK